MVEHGRGHRVPALVSLFYLLLLCIDALRTQSLVVASAVRIQTQQ